jgi:hypothetical protein
MADGASMKILFKAILSLFVLFAAPLQATPFSVRAIAVDADAVVLADANGQLLRYAAGDTLPVPGWRVVSVNAGRIVFEHAGTRPLRVPARVGDQIDFAALAAQARPTPAVILRNSAKPAADR